MMKTYSTQSECGVTGLSRMSILAGYLRRKLTKGYTLMLLEMMLIAVAAPSVAMADPNIQLDMIVAKEVVTEVEGTAVVSWVTTQEIEPGEKLRYTVRYINIGDERATAVKIENPIPELTVYVSDSASGEGSKIVFSADGGKTYGAKDEVAYEAAVFGGGTDRRVANPDRYTNIRWLIEEIAPDSVGEVSFMVVVQ
jgi:uncharacterized repeat protein (TIGR01451 family)